jgi:PAS domain-containing protein
MAEAQAAEARAGPAQIAEALEALTEGIGLFDADGRLVFSNAALRRLNPAVSAQMAPGATWEMLLRSAVQAGAIDRAAADRLLWLEARLAPGGEPETLEIETAQGRIGALTLSATRGGGFVLSHRDVTARRRLEANDRAGDALLREVLEACPAHVVMSRLGDGQVLYRSPAATELLGPTRNINEHFASRDARADFVTALCRTGGSMRWRSTAAARTARCSRRRSRRG